MWWTALIPFALQAIVIFIDEVYFHLKRGLPKWERIGHPLDTLTVVLCLAFVIWVPFSQTSLAVYICLAIFSSVFVTKDEFVHKEHCPASEQWLHAVLFTLHPITLVSAGFIWPVAQMAPVESWIGNWLDQPVFLSLFLKGQLAAMITFLLYQTLYWNWVYDQQ